MPEPDNVHLVLLYNDDQECNVIMPQHQAILLALKRKIRQITGFEDPAFKYDGTDIVQDATPQSLALTDGSLLTVFDREQPTMVTIHIVGRGGEWPELRNCLIDMDTTIATIVDLYLGRYPNISSTNVCFTQKGKTVSEADTLRVLGVQSECQLEVMPTSKMEAESGDALRSDAVHDSGDSGSEYLPEARSSGSSAPVQITQLARQRPLQLKQPSGRPDLSSHFKRRPLELSASSQKALDMIKDSDAYNEEYDNRSYAYRRSNVFIDMEDPIYIHPSSIIPASDIEDERPTYTLRRKESDLRLHHTAMKISRPRPGPGESGFKGSINEHEDCVSQSGRDIRDTQEVKNLHRMHNVSNGHVAKRQKHEHHTGTFIQAGSPHARMRGSRGSHRFKETSHNPVAALTDLASISRRDPGLETQPQSPLIGPLSLIFTHSHDTFPAVEIRTRSDMPLKAAMLRYAQKQGCYVEDLDFRTEEGLIMWDGKTDTPARYGLSDGDKVIVWSARERKQMAQLPKTYTRL